MKRLKFIGSGSFILADGRRIGSWEDQIGADARGVPIVRKTEVLEFDVEPAIAEALTANDPASFKDITAPTKRAKE